MYKTGWGLADWRACDIRWEAVDEVLPEICPTHEPVPSWVYEALPDIKRLFVVNLYATPLGRYDRWAVTPDDLRLANCATIIKRAYRRASNDPSYRMCRARIMPPPEEFHALCSAM